MRLFDYDLLPNKAELDRYINDGYPVGGFLMAVICNDLKEACGRADDRNIESLASYVAYLYNEAPGACWGAPENYTWWLALKAEIRANNEED